MSILRHPCLDGLSLTFEVLNTALEFSLVVVRELQRVREKRGISKRQLALKSGVSRSAILQIESGEHKPSLYIIQALASALGCKLSTLIAKAEKEMAGKR